VKIDSPSGFEQGMICFIQNWLKQHKLKYKTDSLGNILATNNGFGKPTLFCVHMDTVEPGKGIKPIIKNGVIRSSGNTVLGADNKAAVACLMAAVEEYLKTEKNPRAFELLFTVKEETGGGINYFPFNWIKSKQAFVFDSAKPLGGIILRSPNIINFHVEFIGKAAHSSTPEKGKNALTAMVHAMHELKMGKLDKGKTTINIGLIKGGNAINTVAERVNIYGEIRSYQKKLFNKHLKIIKTIFSNAAMKTGLKFSFKTNGYCPGYIHYQKSNLLKKIIKILLNLDLRHNFHYYSGISDANILSSKGIETINLCDGVVNPHTVNESVTIDNLTKLTSIIKHFCYDINQ
jgi:tripeptide aminopeptidase